MKSSIICILTILALTSLSYCDEIHIAAEAGDIAGMETALNANPDCLTLKAPDGNTPLHCAAIAGKLDAVKFLVEKGCPVDIGDNEHTTPLQVAGMRGNFDVVKYLTEKGADVNFIDDNGFSVVRWASYFGKTDVVKYLISKNANVNTKDRNNQTPLHGACAYGHLEIIKILVDAGADMNAVNRYDFTPLISSIWAGKTESARTLIGLGADINFKNPSGESAIFFAAMKGNIEVMNILLAKGADINAKNINGWTPMTFTAREGRTETARYLLSKGASLQRDVVYEGGLTLLHAAVWSDSVSYVKFLIENKFDPNAKNRNGMTPFLSTALNGNYEMVKAFIEGGAKVNSKYKDTGKTPLHIAAQKGLGNIVELLINNGAKINVKDKNGRTPLYYALKYEQKNSIDILTAAGAKMNGDFVLIPTKKLLKQKLDKGEAQIWHLGNCGFVVRTQNNCMIFDYWKGWGAVSDNPCLANGFVDPAELKGQNVTVFVSHEHGDHFDEAIFGWKDTLPDAKYVFGCIPENTVQGYRQNHAGFEYTYTAPRTTAKVGDIAVRTLKANDAGVGFLIEADGVKFYHAGDHAGWNEGEKAGFTDEIDYITPFCDNLDFAFVNVTGCHAHGEIPLREGTYYTMDKLHPKVLIPTHGLDREEVYAQFMDRMKRDGYNVESFCAQGRGDYYEYLKEDTGTHVWK